MPTKPDTEFVADNSIPNTENYLTTNYFKLYISRAPAVSYYTQKVSFPQISQQEMILGTDISTQIPFAGNLYTFNPLIVEFLVDENLRSWQEIYNWIYHLGNYTSVGEQYKFKDQTSDITLQITNSAYKPKFEIIFRHAFPISLSEIPFSVTATDNVPIRVTASFKYTYYDFKVLTSS
jgi:hypothetical protein